MRAYHLDLRLRVVAAVDAGLPITQVARHWHLHRSTVYRFLAQRRAQGTLVPRPHPGPASTITPADAPRLVAQFQQYPTATLAEHCAHWAATTGRRLSRATMSRAIRRIGWTRKKGRWQPASETRACGLPGGRRR